MKLNSFMLPIEVIKKMEGLIELSLANNKEMGFNLCKKDDNELIADSHHMGNEHELPIIRSCTKGKYVGHYHTHPPGGGGRSNLSFNDIAHIYYDGIGCVAGTLDGLIYCHTRKGDIDTKSKEKIVHGFNKFEKKILSDGTLKHEDKLEYDKTIKKLQDELFRTFLVEELYEEEYME